MTDKLALIKAWIDRSKAFHASYDALSKVIGVTLDRFPFGELAFKEHDVATNLLAENIGAGDWLTWFEYETDFGAKELEAGIECDIRTIKTASDLLWLIELTP